MSEAETHVAGPERRALLKGAVGLAATTIAPGVTLYAFGMAEADAAASSKKRWGLLIDLN